MRIEEYVSDWELEEIRQELKAGTAADIVAFQHAIPTGCVREYARGRGYARHIRKMDERWTEAEMEFVRNNYPNHGREWCDWEFLSRSWDAIRARTCMLKVKRKRNAPKIDWKEKWHA